MEIDEIKKKVLEDVDPQLRSQKKKEMRKARLVISLQFLALAAVILLVFYLMMGFSTVTGNSMYPTLHDKDIVAYFRLGKEYRPGDVIVLERPDGEEFVKRVVAVAGDTVNIQSGKVYVNGEEAKFKGTLGKTRRTGSSVEYPVVVEDKEVFVLGDNREISEDSREFGAVKNNDIKGRIIWYLGRL